jgi:predicted DCC family thiol-disulfide oxidoreductase YuxK
LKDNIAATHSLNNTSIILFDGVCNLCVASVQFIIKRDSKRNFQFAALQSNSAKNLLAPFDIEACQLNSFYCIQHGVCLERTDAALLIAGQLDGYWWLTGGLRWIPRKIRDALYDALGSQRYRLFGKRNVCLVPDDFSPDSDLQNRFILD